MRTKVLALVVLVFACAAIVSICSGAWALDEAILTPTNSSVKSHEDDAFSAAMDVWLSHRYSDGEKLLREFSKKNANSRWAAEADLHVGCYLVYGEKYSEAKKIFGRLADQHRDTNIQAKATVRLGNIAEQEGRWDDAIQLYSSILGMSPTWDQFKYANYRARKLSMSRGALQAKLNCGPVALAACLEKLGKGTEAVAATAIKPTAEGLSLFALSDEAEKLGVTTQSVELPLEDLQDVSLPILAHILPNHYVAILGITGDKVRIEDSIQGKYELPLSALAEKWSGKVMTFAPDSNLKPLSLVAALEATGGCCGKASEEECMGSCKCHCQQQFVGGSGSPSGACSSCSGPRSAGRPSWQVNTVNLNVIVEDTPIWYDPGKGPQTTFTLTYSNENSNTGVFGRGWRCPYDMKVFFLPGYDQDHPTLQLHLGNGRIETYQWQLDYASSSYKYLPRVGYAAYGYRDEIKILSTTEAATENIADGEGTVMLELRGGGKCFFKKGGSGPTIEGRVYIVQDQNGNRVTCGFTNGCLSSITDANGAVTTITTTGTGINERVTEIELPSGDGRTAQFGYTEGNLTSITDMLGDTSYLSYNALLPSYPQQFAASTYLAQNVTESSPANGGSLTVDSTDGFLPSGKIQVNYNEEMSYQNRAPRSFTGITRGSTPQAASSGAYVAQVVPSTDLQSDITDTSPANGGQLIVLSTEGFPETGYIVVQSIYGYETIYHTGKTSTAFTGITRGDPAYSAAASSDVWLCVQTPYLDEIVTPSKKAKFAYEWAGNGTTGPILGLHEVRECGPTESYPQVATIHYAWCDYRTKITRYATSITPGQSGCSDHWTGGLTRTYDFLAFYDATSAVHDELEHTIVSYGYNGYRDMTSVTTYHDASDSHTAYYDYGSDGKHNMYSYTDPLSNQWNYTYYADYSLETEQDPYASQAGRYTKRYTYSPAGEVTKTETQLAPGTWTTLSENHYDAYGRIDWSKDGRGKQTSYHYNENGETRGFLTSVHDPEDKATIYRYDAKGRRDQVMDPDGNTTTYEYDDLDRVTRVTNPDSTTVESYYTCCHNVYDQDEHGRRIYHVYDAKNRPFKEIASAASTTLAQGITTSSPADGGNLGLSDATGFPTSGKVVVLDEIMSYTGKNGNTLTNVTRGADSTRRVEIDSGFAVGRVDTVQATYGYHSNYLNRKAFLTDALGHTTYYTYYPNEKSETIRYPDNTGEKYYYDYAGNTVTKECGTFTGTYPDQTFTATSSETLNYEHDANNRLLRTYH